MTETLSGRRFHIKGIVQGVGFRPYVYRLAAEHGITGWVRNTSHGVEIEVSGSLSALCAFEENLRLSPPPLARIDLFTSDNCPANHFSKFEILESQPIPGEFIPISPDVSICPDCQRELFDPTDRRFRYPFINCTNCGPRFTIIRDIPYDRPNTTMLDFPLCPDCLKEYENPADRRFHAQPVACPVCGPQVSLEADHFVRSLGENAIQAARQILAAGKILAIKGLGGYHLACDATNSSAVATLRERKQRNEKPFALMAFSVMNIKQHCIVSKEEEHLLISNARPVVILEQNKESKVVAEVAPGQKTLGVMLAYTPLHLLLLEPFTGFPDTLVMTSGNMSEEPIAYEDDDARVRLNILADAFLTHNRPIHTRVDDSVARVIQKKTTLSRRSRGYAPEPLLLIEDTEPILASGAEIKNTFCLTRGRYAFISHHIGDLENYETLRAFEDGVKQYQQLFHVHPTILACDLHPDYLATRYAQQRAVEENLPLIQVQHHHAHLAACLAENGWDSSDPVIGLTFDGTGWGSDRAIWGGEILIGGYSSYQRWAHLAYVPLPGGDITVRKPARMALSHLWANGMDWFDYLPPYQAIGTEERKVLASQLETGLNSPPTSSMGRLFDAVAGLIGIRQTIHYEGQAAMELEALADQRETGFYPIPLENNLIQVKPLLEAILKDYNTGVSASQISTRFHNGIIQMCRNVCQKIRREQGIRTIALSGGVWQNRYLLSRALAGFEADGFQVLIHRRLPPNDGCISLGQAMVAWHTRKVR